MKDIKLFPIFKWEGKRKRKREKEKAKEADREMFSEEQELAHKRTHT